MPPPLPPITSPDTSLSYDGAAIVFQSRIAPWLRILMLVFVLPLAVCLPLFIGALVRADWAAMRLVDLAGVTFFLLILPLILAGGAMAFALCRPAEHLRLDPARAEARLTRQTPFGRRHWRYPLRAVVVDRVEIEGEHPAFDTSRLRLRMPEGRAVWIAGFCRAQEARGWLAAIRALVSEAAPGPR